MFNCFSAVDWINIKGYGMYTGPWPNKYDKTGHHSATYPHNGVNDARYDNVEDAVNHWKTLGAPTSKLVLGVPSYGETFKLSDYYDHNNGIGALAAGPGYAGYYTNKPGYLAYFEVILFFYLVFVLFAILLPLY